MDNKEKLDRIVNLYDTIESFFDNIPDAIPETIKKKLKDSILEDKELRQLIDDIRNKRAPRLLLIGNTGHGKSSLINALLGYYSATVSDVTIGTRTNNEPYDIYDENGETIYKILDSRGINESTKDGNSEAEKNLLNDISKFTPDAIIFVHKASERSGLKHEIPIIKSVSEQYFKENGQELPLVFVLTKCDELAPITKHEPKEYNETKWKNIDEAKTELTTIITENGLNPKTVVVTSSLMEYEGISNEDMAKLSISERKKIKPTVDGRYNIDKLQDILCDVIKDSKALMGAALYFRTNKILKSIAKKLTNIFAGVGAVIALEPIPIADMFILFALEAVLVMFIAMLSGRDLSYKAAGEYILGLGGVAGIGFICKKIAQQGAKLINLFPGAGSAISAAVASSGVKSIGEAAIKYFFKEEENK